MGPVEHLDREITWEWPHVTLAIACLVATAFLLQLVLAPEACYASRYPAICAELALLRRSIWLGVVLMPFLHGSWFHLGSNLLTFLVLGSVTERWYGRWTLLWLFVVAGYLSTEIQLLEKLAADRTPITVGISGAVFGLGAFLGVMLCPTSRTGLAALHREVKGPGISLRPPLLVVGLFTMAYALSTHGGVVPIDSKTATLSHLVGAGFGASTAVCLRAIDSNLSIPSIPFAERN